MNPLHFRSTLLNEARAYVNTEMITTHYLNNKDENGLFSLNVMGLHNDLDINSNNPDGYFYYVNGRSKYGSIHKVGP